MIHTDTALSLIRESFDKLGLTYHTKEMNSEKLFVDVEKNDMTFQTWFDVGHQAFGFNMLQGGYKAYKSIEEFEKFFDTYITIQTVFLPTVKTVSDYFMSVTGKQLAYEKFIGNRNDGFRAIYYVLGQDNIQAHIYHKDNIYTVDILEITDESKPPIMHERYTYKLNEDNTCEAYIIYDIQSYINSLASKYRGSEDFGMRRTGANEFEVLCKKEDITIYYTVEFPNNEKVVFSVTEVLNGADRTTYDTPVEFELSDPFNLSEMLENVKNIGSEKTTEEPAVEETTEEPIAEETSEETTEEIAKEPIAEETTDETPAEESIEEPTQDLDPLGSVNSDEPTEDTTQDLDPLGSVGSDESIEKTSDLSSLDEVIAENRPEEKLSGIDDIVNDEDDSDDEFSFSPDDTRGSEDTDDDADVFSFSPEDTTEEGTSEESVSDESAESSTSEETETISDETISEVTKEEPISDEDTSDGAVVETTAEETTTEELIVETVEESTEEPIAEEEWSFSANDTTEELNETVSDVSEKEEINMDATASEDSNNINSQKETLSMDDFILKLVKDEYDNNKFVRFSFKDKIEDIGFEKAVKLGIPVKKIKESVKLYMSHGIELTDEEAKNRIFADIVTDDDARCKELVDAIFS